MQTPAFVAGQRVIHGLSKNLTNLNLNLRQRLRELCAALGIQALAVAARRPKALDRQAHLKRGMSVGPRGRWSTKAGNVRAPFLMLTIGLASFGL
jgi:hypothetical protein